MNINELTPDKLQTQKTLTEWIDQAESGDQYIAAALLREAAIYTHNGLPMIQPLSSYIATALYESSLSVLGGDMDIGEILNIKIPRGGSKYKNSYEQMKLCAAVQLEILENPDLPVTTEDGVCGIVADKYEKKDKDNVYDAWKSVHKNRLEIIAKKPLEMMTKPELKELIEMLESIGK